VSLPRTFIHNNRIDVGLCTSEECEGFKSNKHRKVNWFEIDMTSVRSDVTFNAKLCFKRELEITFQLDRGEVIHAAYLDFR
jgi:hypothetical protein